MKKQLYTLICGMLLIVLASCGERTFPVPESSEVDADFNVSFDPSDFAPTTATFTSTTLVAEGVTGVSYTWNFGDGSTGDGEDVSHNYDIPGDYQVSLIVKTDNDLDFIEKTVVVKDPTALSVEVLFIDAIANSIINVDGSSFSVPGEGYGIAYDASNQLIYFTDDTNDTFSSVKRDGSDMTVLVSSGLSEPRDIALDLDNNKAYIADRGVGVNQIIEVDLTDNSTSVLYDVAGGLGELPISVDYYDGNLYITCVEVDSESVWVGATDGSSITNIISFSSGGFGYGIAIDAVNEKIYFDDSNAGVIRRSNLDGSSIEEIVETSDRVYGLAVDNTNGKIYWTESRTGNVFIANLDGSNKATIGSGFDDATGLIFIE